jgi:hypothetical protein
MRTVTECQRRRPPAIQSELLGLIEHGWITVGGGDHHESWLAGGYFGATDEMILGTATAGSPVAVRGDRARAGAVSWRVRRSVRLFKHVLSPHPEQVLEC